MKIVSSKLIAIGGFPILFFLAGCQSSHDVSDHLKKGGLGSLSSRTIIINKGETHIEPNLISIKIIYEK